MTTIAPTTTTNYEWKYHAAILLGEEWLDNEYHGIDTCDQILMLMVCGNFSSRLTHLLVLKLGTYLEIGMVAYHGSLGMVAYVVGSLR